MANLLKGAPVAAALTDKLTAQVILLQARGISPVLAILRVGERPNDLAYERGAMKRCEKIGVAVKIFALPADCTQADLLRAIDRINRDPEIHGCLMFRPLPAQIDEPSACSALAPEKDVDGITGGSMNKVFSGKGTGFAPCTAQACLEILNHYGYDPTGERIAVVGRSLVIGKPVAMMLLNRNATVTICHSKTKNLPACCREAKILIAAVGRAEMIDESYVSPGQIVIDVGINLNDKGNLCGDVQADRVEEVVDAITPVPGGVGTVTTTVLAMHVIQAAERSEKRKNAQPV